MSQLKELVRILFAAGRDSSSAACHHLHRENAHFIDEDLLTFLDNWSSAGHTHAVVRLMPDELVSISQGQSVDIKS